MNEKKQLCPNCQTGLDALKLDARIPMCPYLYCHNGTVCSQYKELTQRSKFYKK